MLGQVLLYPRQSPSELFASTGAHHIGQVCRFFVVGSKYLRPVLGCVRLRTLRWPHRLLQLLRPGVEFPCNYRRVGRLEVAPKKLLLLLAAFPYPRHYHGVVGQCRTRRTLPSVQHTSIQTRRAAVRVGVIVRVAGKAGIAREARGRVANAFYHRYRFCLLRVSVTEAA